MSKWLEREDEIQALVDKGLTDEQIGAVYGRGGNTIWKVRKLLGIASKIARRKRKSFAEVFQAPVEAPPVEVETYVDEEGRTIKRYPARYADGALIQVVTAKLRGKRG